LFYTLSKHKCHSLGGKLRNCKKRYIPLYSIQFVIVVMWRVAISLQSFYLPWGGLYHGVACQQLCGKCNLGLAICLYRRCRTNQHCLSSSSCEQHLLQVVQYKIKNIGHRAPCPSVTSPIGTTAITYILYPAIDHENLDNRKPATRPLTHR
jgi:hypothetical protein